MVELGINVEENINLDENKENLSDDQTNENQNNSSNEQNISDECFTAIGTGGSINKLYSLSSKTFKEPIQIEELRNVVNHVTSFSFNERIIKLALKPDRADVIVPSGEIYIKVMEAIKANQMIVPRVGLADGMIYNLFLDHEISSKEI